MRRVFAYTGMGAAGVLALALLAPTRVAAQDPILTPIIVNETAPIVVKAITPKPLPEGTRKFQGYVMHANSVQVTVRAKGDDKAIETFPLSDTARDKMQQIINKGGYQYGDKITVYYDAQTHKALKFKGKPSRAL